MTIPALLRFLLPLLVWCSLAAPARADAAGTREAPAVSPQSQPQQPSAPQEGRPGNAPSPDAGDDNAEDDSADAGDDDADDDADNDNVVDPTSPCPHRIRTCWPADVARAQQRLDALPPPDGSGLADRLADAVHDSPEFGGTVAEPGWHWQWRFEPGKDRAQAPERSSWLQAAAEFLRELSRAFGTLGHVVLWLLLLLLLVLLWRKRDELLGSLARRDDARRMVAGVDIAPLLAPDALPDDVLAGADRLWQAGHPREALSLLYRAALHRLSARHDFPIPESGTEADCLALVERHADREIAAAFRVLVNAWIRMAWQDRPPAEAAPLHAAWRRIAGLPAADVPAGFAEGNA